MENKKLMLDFQSYSQLYESNKKLATDYQSINEETIGKWLGNKFHDVFGKNVKARAAKISGPDMKLLKKSKIVEGEGNLSADVMNAIKNESMDKIIDAIIKIFTSNVGKDAEQYQGSYFMNYLYLLKKQFSVLSQNSAIKAVAEKGEKVQQVTDDMKSVVEAMQKNINASKVNLDKTFESEKEARSKDFRIDRKKNEFKLESERRKNIAESILLKIEGEVLDRLFGSKLSEPYKKKAIDSIKKAKSFQEQLNKITAEEGGNKETLWAKFKEIHDTMIKPGADTQYNNTSNVFVKYLDKDYAIGIEDKNGKKIKVPVKDYVEKSKNIDKEKFTGIDFSVFSN